MRLLPSYIIILSLLLGTTTTEAQESQEVATIQPSIIVIPFAKEDENLRTVLEDDVAKRVAITKVKEGFDNRGFTTIDFIATLKALSVDDVMTSDDLSDVKSSIIEASRADIYVEVDVQKEGESGGAQSARIILSAYDAFTARSLGNKTGASPKSRADFTKLVERALSRTTADGQRVELIDEFLDVMQEKFSDIVKNGRPIKIIFTLDQNVMYDFGSECISGDLLSDEIEFWLDDNAYKSNFSDPRVTDLRVIVDEVRIPLKNSRGRNYRPSRFASSIRKFLRDLNVPDNGGGITVDTDIRGGTIYVSLQ